MTSTSPLPRPDPSPLRVLIVDDMPQVLHDLRQLLELTGLFEIVGEAGDGPQAVRRAAELRPAAVVMDLRLPGMSGLEATRRIKAHDPAVRVVILTAYADPEAVEQARQAGADAFVMKGDRYEVLVRRILGQDGSPFSLESQEGG